jgi:DUF4097 and DUF4098 domain-containing protein YvlB
MRFLRVLLVCAASLYAVATEDHIQKSVPAGSATRLTVNAEFGAIRVQPSTGRTVEVEVYFRGTPPSNEEFDKMLRDFALNVSQQGSEVRVSGTFKDGWQAKPLFGFFSFCRQMHNGRCLIYSGWLREIEYRVTVPREFSTDLATSGGSISVGDLKGEVKARTSGGSLNFGRIDGPVNGNTSGGSITLAGGKGRAVVHTSGGSIRIMEATGDVDASTSGGSISIDRAAGRVNAHTSGGGITVREVTGVIDASTSGGGVTASLLAQPKEECRLSTSGGSINVTVGKDVHIYLDASTSGGSVSTDFPVPTSRDRHRHELRAPLNGGGPALRLHTSGGGISVRRAA